MMSKKIRLMAVGFGLLLAITGYADEKKTEVSTQDPKIKYKSGKDVDFEQLLIQGQLKRPELTVVTGNTDQGTDGLLRLRENFIDRITIAVGEELQ